MAGSEGPIVRSKANDLKSAHIVQASFDSLAQRAQSCTPEQFSEAYRNFVLQVQAHLGETGDAPIPA